MRLPPAQFWQLSLAEWQLLVGTPDAMDRARFDTLATTYPDENT